MGVAGGDPGPCVPTARLGRHSKRRRYCKRRGEEGVARRGHQRAKESWRRRRQLGQDPHGEPGVLRRAPRGGATRPPKRTSNPPAGLQAPGLPAGYHGSTVRGTQTNFSPCLCPASLPEGLAGPLLRNGGLTAVTPNGRGRRPQHTHAAPGGGTVPWVGTALAAKDRGNRTGSVLSIWLK